MFRRILTTTALAAAIVAAAPALAAGGEKTESSRAPTCCEQMLKQLREAEARADAAEKAKAPREDTGSRYDSPFSSTEWQ